MQARFLTFSGTAVCRGKSNEIMRLCVLRRITHPFKHQSVTEVEGLNIKLVKRLENQKEPGGLQLMELRYLINDSLQAQSDRSHFVTGSLSCPGCWDMTRSLALFQAWYGKATSLML
jgi:hypothetical protein